MMRRSGSERDRAAADALANLESAVDVAAGDGRFYKLGDLAKAAFEASDHDKARAYAIELLDPDSAPTWSVEPVTSSVARAAGAPAATDGPSESHSRT